MTGSTEKTTVATPAIVIRKWHLVLLLCPVLIAAPMIYSHNADRVAVRVARPVFQDIESTVSAVGTVTPVNDFAARANFSGIVEDVYVHLGEKVHSGEMLILMKDQYALSRLLTARAALASAEVNSENVQNNGSREDQIDYAADIARAQNEQIAAARALSSLRQLVKNGSVSEDEVFAWRQRLQVANAALQALNDRITKRYSSTDIASWQDKVAADKASLNAEKVSFANAHISSPISGVVYVIPVSRYDFVPMGSELLHVADLSRVHVHAEFEEPDIGKLHIGQPATLTWDGKPNLASARSMLMTPRATYRSM
jgi:HlyD family secretion protein